ncbi:hypothetical protein BCT30_20505 [Enterovibrio norvegicus]|uniref:Uncharacterized protein n=3 Tax=Enterovibrio norvegicus TaxID=188144 RepID=A0A2N7L893_9GAMM|nr:hypothetical protein [Enterovibrio norvegicus]MCC4800862.1 hypothetical protein [Enterovibrio norvegicus]OEE65311.1 hypothetical protein A1OS_14515 [Enterovibrio norvegicus]OEF54323.1 hypothetical protein A1OW_22310 [Enterovibrio norvegicus]OEF58560.1 hypothetical protein A1OU_10360 [Enterovibrio norvegicus]PMH72015.1 hypothetical protein BCU62_23880 [Enterovibrio norvegicus]
MDAFLLMIVIVAAVLAVRTCRSYVAYQAQLREFEVNHQKSSGLHKAYQKEIEALKQGNDLNEADVSSQNTHSLCLQK